MLSSAVLYVLAGLNPCFLAPYAGKVAACSGRISTRLGASPFYVMTPLRTFAWPLAALMRVIACRSSSCNLALCYLHLAHRPLTSNGCPQGHRSGNQLKGAGRNHARTWLCRTQSD